MNKNTIIAIVLSTVVVVGSIFLQSYFMPKSPAPVQETVAEENADQAEVATSEEKIVKSSLYKSNVKEESEEKTVCIKTNHASIVLTNRGGDIISYKLNDHIDVDTKEGVEMVDNVTGFNRACAVALGNVDDFILNDLFTTEQIDENTASFTKKYSKSDDEGKVSNFVLKKTYTFIPKEYMFKLDIEILNENNSEISYTLRTSPQIGPHFNPKLNRYENRQFISFDGEKAKRQVINQKQFKSYNKSYLYNGIAGKYFEEIVIPVNSENMDNTYYSTLIETNDYANAQAILVRKATTEKEIKDSYYMYFGPRNEKDLKAYNKAENNLWELSGCKLDYSLNTNGWLGWLETILKWVMEVINKFVHNWGVSIIIMTILIKLLMFPVTRKQSLSTLKMQELQPKIQALQSKYQNNPQKLQTEMAKLYKDNGYNPMSGCLPMVVQFLILWSMYNLFNNYFEFRGASFIPNWIEDLSSGDKVYTFKFSIPFFGSQLRILPFIYLASQLLFGKITGNGGTAAPGSTQAQMKMMMYGMPIMFFVLFYNAPSGLLLYWTVSNVFQLGQQLIINNTMNKKRAELTQKKNK